MALRLLKQWFCYNSNLSLLRGGALSSRWRGTMLCRSSLGNAFCESLRLRQYDAPTPGRHERWATDVTDDQFNGYMTESSLELLVSG
jgi:hypothetical protein